MCHVGADTQTPCQVASNGNPKTNAERATFVSRKIITRDLTLNNWTCTGNNTSIQSWSTLDSHILMYILLRRYTMHPRPYMLLWQDRCDSCMTTSQGASLDVVLPYVD